jgi:hypothetical protein
LKSIANVISPPSDIMFVDVNVSAPVLNNLTTISSFTLVSKIVNVLPNL